MQNVDLKLSVSDTTMTLIDDLRGGRSREEILRQIVELGLCELLEATTRTHRDYLMHTLAGNSKDYRVARANLFSIHEPEAAGSVKNDAIREVSSRSGRNW